MSFGKMWEFFVAPTKTTRELTKPNSRFASVFEIDFRFLQGFHLISDWDGVWVEHGKAPTQRAFEKLEEAVASCETVSILSNCDQERQSEMRGLLSPIAVNFYRAVPKKPHPEAFCEVFTQLHLTPAQVRINTAYIGDRLYTDVFGARSADIGIVIKVAPLSNNEPFGIRVARAAETWRYGSNSFYSRDMPDVQFNGRAYLHKKD